ncbi:MAG: adenosylmethionine decarboxylase [Planctomycetaceae bacterium]
MPHIGRHVLFELWRCNGGVDSADVFRAAIPEIVDAIGATLLHQHVHRFNPQGVTGLAVLAESHLSLHSWPEHGYLAADVFTCGRRVDPLQAGPVLERIFEPDTLHVLEIARGVDAPDGSPAIVPSGNAYCLEPGH